MPELDPNSRFRRLGRALLAFTLFAGLSVPAAAVERWVPFGPVGGIVKRLVQATSDPQYLYAATDPIGVFRSRDGGLSWQSIQRGLEGLAIRHLAVDPKNPQVVLVNTGGGRPFVQVWRSENGGSTWIQAVKTPQSPAGFERQTYDVLFDSISPRTIYAATVGGIFRSLDGGSTWDSWALSEVFTLAIVRDPAAPTVWYASCGNGLSLLNGALYKSDDGGATWRATPSVGGPGFDNLPERLFFRAGALYAIWNGALYRSTDGADSWSLAARLPTLSAFDFAFAPSGSIYAATGAGVYSSTDGVSWSPPEATSPDQAAPRDATTRLALVGGGPSPGSETVVAAGRRGIWRSTDGGNAWSAANRGIIARNVRSLSVIPNPQGTLLGSFEDSLYRIDREEHSWRRLPRQAGFEDPTLAADPHHPGRVYGLGLAVGLSDDLGQTWRTVGALPPHDAVDLFRVDPVHRGVLYAGVEIDGGSAVNGFAYRSIDGGATWTEILAFDHLLDFTFDPAHPGVGYRAKSSGVDQTADGGATWTPLPNLQSQLRGASPTSILLNPRSHALYLGTDVLGVFRSTDGGRTFRRIDGGLPRTGRLNPRVTSLILDASGDVYAGLDRAGVFRLVPGLGWTAVNTDLPVTTFRGRLLADPARSGLLYAPTLGSSVLRLGNP